MNVLFISPGYPGEMPFFTRGLARVGARVFGLGAQPRAALPEMTQMALSGYLQVQDLWDEQAVADQVRRSGRQVPIDRIECLWEPGMIPGSPSGRGAGSVRARHSGDRAVPRQGADETDAGRSGNPHPASRRLGALRHGLVGHVDLHTLAARQGSSARTAERSLAGAARGLLPISSSVGRMTSGVIPR